MFSAIVVQVNPFDVPNPNNDAGTHLQGLGGSGGQGCPKKPCFRRPFLYFACARQAGEKSVHAMAARWLKRLPDYAAARQASNRGWRNWAGLFDSL
jgi:hypothetical protein